MLRIAIIAETFQAGAARCALDLKSQMSLRGHEVRYYPRGSEREKAGSVLEDLKQFRPDVVHLHSYYSNLPYGFLATVSNLYPTVFSPHDPRPLGTMWELCWDCDKNAFCYRCPLVRSRLKRLLPHAHFRQRLKKRLTHARSAPTMKIVAASRWYAGRLAKSELSRFATEQIYYGIDLERFRKVAEARRILGVQENEKVIFHMAASARGWGLNRRKGMKVLSDAFLDFVLPAHPECRLWIAGEEYALNHPNVRTLGRLDHEQLSLYYSAADIFALPTLADNLPYTALEAMACGVPVVGSSVGGVPEEIEDGITGFLVPPGDARALGERLVRLLDEPELRTRMGREGRRKAESTFDMATFISRYEELYRKAANKP